MRRNKFSLSHYTLKTMDMGQLVPLTWLEVLPGDTLQQATAALIRVSPLLSPVMHPVRVRIHHFYVCLRDIWEDFEDFITGGPDGTSTPTHPYVAISASPTESDLQNHMGIPTGTWSNTINVSALPFRAYAKIFNEFYRDQDLVTELTVSESSGADSSTNSTLQKVSWEKDRLTTSRPWATKGNTLTVPLSGESPIFGDNIDFDGVEDADNIFQVRDASGSSANLRTLETGGSDLHGGSGTSGGTGELKADLSQATGMDINSLRWSLALQRYQEARAQYGSRYSEYLRYLGVNADDRLDEAVYLGGGRQTISFSEVLSTDGANTGELYGHGISAIRSNRYRRFFKEHGIVMSLMSVVPKAIYTQAIPKKWSRTVKEDYFQRELQTTGEDEVLNQEVYLDHTTPGGTFGYQARYDEYRSHPSNISGEFHSTLNHYHYGRIFSADPALNQTFTDCTPTKRVNASSSTDCLYVMANHSIQARRAMAKYAKPKTF